MKLDTGDPEFVASARAWLASLSDATLIRFADVVDLSPGYFPTTLHELWLLELAARGLSPLEEQLFAVYVASLPVGHPLDYDWRFTESTREALLARATALTEPGDLVAYFGTPTLFADAASGLPDRRHVLVDANAAMVAALQRRLGTEAAIRLRLGVDAAPPLSADLVVMDPPWYLTDTLTFLAAAAVSVRHGGHAVLSQPTEATRPGVAAERVELLEAGTLLGWDLLRVERAALRYLTPHFERMSIGTASPELVIRDDWRLGDMLIFERSSRVGVGVDEWVGIAEDEWGEVSFGPVRIKVRRAGETDLEEVVDGLDRLVTVSRRDPLRHDVGLWTSGNRVRTLATADTVARLIKMCETDLQNMTFTHESTRRNAAQLGVDSRVADRLFDLLLLEYQEHVAGGYGVMR